MLAYFFYHWKRSDVDARDYESRLRDFHTALKAAPSDGFSRSWSAALRGLPWANSGQDSYEDWYLVRSSADLDPLNDAAISASRKMPHDKVAAGTENVSAGLYRVRAGAVIDNPHFTTWLSKPDGWSYPQLLDALQPLTSAGALWQRQMALGPGEFCLHTEQSVSLPAGLTGRSLELRRVFPAGV